MPEEIKTPVGTPETRAVPVSARPVRIEIEPPYDKETPDSAPFSKLHRNGLISLLVLVILFGAWVELRGALQHTRKTDVGTYLRGAWAVRNGGDLYSITDDRGWHYVYPPFFAIMMTPLADPPSGASRAGYVPYAVTVGFWYLLTMALGFWGVHILAGALEDESGGPPRVLGRKWWALRILPVLVLLPAIGRSQMRGQVGLLIAFLLCVTAANLVRGKKFRAGLWLSAAIAIKLIPALLILMPLWRRSWRMLGGIALGLVLTLGLIPLAAMGPARTAAAYSSFYNEVIKGGLEGNTKSAVGGELTGITSTDSNSPMVVIHNIMYFSVPRGQRPPTAAPWVRAAHWIFAILLTATALLAAGWKKGNRQPADEGISDALFLISLAPLMLIGSPVFHPHYVSMLLPVTTVLIYLLWDRYSYGHMPSVWKAIFIFLVASHLLTSIDKGFFFYLRDFGLVLLSTLFLWAGAAYMLFKTRRAVNFP